MINSSNSPIGASFYVVLLCFIWALNGCIKSKPEKFVHEDFAAQIFLDHYSSKTDSVSGFTIYPPPGGGREFRMPDEATIAILKTNPNYKEAFPDDADLNPLFTTHLTASVDFPYDGTRFGAPENSVTTPGTITISNPIFDSSGKKVVVYYECQFGDERAEGVYVLAESRDGRWQNFKYIMAWDTLLIHPAIHEPSRF